MASWLSTGLLFVMILSAVSASNWNKVMNWQDYQLIADRNHCGRVAPYGMLTMSAILVAGFCAARRFAIFNT
uniref:Uncharacterized protein n=1 Tax=Plectus sambesii TaxID=2011161 RepID=A0A914UN29_9BILA